MGARRTKDEIIAAIDAKIAYHVECNRKLQAKREALLAPPKPKQPRARKTSMRQAIDALKDAQLTPDEILAMAKKAKKAK